MSRLNKSHLIFSGITAWLVATFRLSDGGSITWFEPSPFETVTDPSSVPRVYIGLTKGSPNEELSCNFSLTADLTLITASIKFSGSAIASFVQSQQALLIQPGFESRFNVTWVPNKLTLIFFNATSANEGEYACEVLSVGGSVQTWRRIIQVLLLVQPSIIEISENQTVIETFHVNLNCSAEGNPMPTITWTRLLDNNEVTMPLNFDMIRRQDAGKYRCTADNGIGNPATGDVWIVVQYKPDNVSLVANTTENSNCSDILWVNFTCEASDAVPPVESYQLLKNGETQATRNDGTWIRKISEAKDHVYGCRALHFLGNVTADNVIVTFSVPAQISVFASGSEVLIQGGNVSLYCSASGYPNPTVTWLKLNADGFTELSRWLNFTNIRRDEAGDYICVANNTCGKRNSSRRTIDVLYPVEATGKGQNYSLDRGSSVRFKCPVGGNPEPNIIWYNGSTVPICFEKELESRESGCYTCVADNSLGRSVKITQCLTISTGTSSTTTPTTSTPSMRGPESTSSTTTPTTSTPSMRGPESTRSTTTPTTSTPSTRGPERQEIRAILTIITNYEQALKNLNSAFSKEFVAKFEQEMDQVYTNMPEYIRTEITHLRYQIMLNCWQSKPETRPSFNDLTQLLKRMENQHKRLINMHINDNTLCANLEDLNA